MKKDTI